jgi:hypothetical protein
MLGYQYGGCYYYTDVGFDPEYAKWSVVRFLQLKVMQDLYQNEDVPSFSISPPAMVSTKSASAANRGSNQYPAHAQNGTLLLYGGVVLSERVDISDKCRRARPAWPQARLKRLLRRRSASPDEHGHRALAIVERFASVLRARGPSVFSSSSSLAFSIVVKTSSLKCRFRLARWETRRRLAG